MPAPVPAAHVHSLGACTFTPGPLPPSHVTTNTEQTYYKLSYVDRRIDSPEQRVCEDVPKLAAGLADLTRECLTALGACAGPAA